MNSFNCRPPWQNTGQLTVDLWRRSRHNLNDHYLQQCPVRLRLTHTGKLSPADLLQGGVIRQHKPLFVHLPTEVLRSLVSWLKFGCVVHARAGVESVCLHPLCACAVCSAGVCL